jgi:hypothetical protein
VPRAYWRLKYDPDVIAKLYVLRERGSAAHGAIKALAVRSEPWTGMRVAGELVTWYEFEVEGYLVGFSVSTNPEDKEPTLRIHYGAAVLSRRCCSCCRRLTST